MAINSSNISLELAHRLTDVVNAAWKSGEMLEKVTPTTASLLNYWFGEGFCNERERNFHEGQRQAILNIIYLHEVMGENCVMDAYQGIIPELMDRAALAQLAKPKYQMPKYAVKMATGTGKTWVMHALIGIHHAVFSHHFVQIDDVEDSLSLSLMEVSLTLVAETLSKPIVQERSGGWGHLLQHLPTLPGCIDHIGESMRQFQRYIT